MLMVDGRKRCPGCCVILDISSFSVDSHTKDGLKVRCIACRSKEYREYMKTKPHARMLYLQAYRLEHKDKTK